MPKNLQPAITPLILVCGAPASGKTTYANEHAEAVIDLDDIVADVSGYPFREAPLDYLGEALDVRNSLLRTLASESGPPTAFIVGAPEGDERTAWAEMLEPQQVIVLNPGERTCIARITQAEDRRFVRRRQVRATRRWYALFTPSRYDTMIGNGSKASPYKRLYDTRAWLRLRARHLQRSPLCEYCLARGRLNDGTRTAAGDVQTNEFRMSLIVDHVEPHHGDAEKFFKGKLQTLCADHHDRTKQGEESRGYTTQIGSDGWPVDANHPGNRSVH